MPKQLKYRRTEKEIEEIKGAMRWKHPKVVQRATMLYALHLGDAPSEVAERHDVVVATVYNVVKLYDAEGLDGLMPQRSSGRPRLFTEAQCQELVKLVESDPRDYGYAFSIWTSRRLQTYIAEVWGIRASEGTIRNTLKYMGYVYRRPKTSKTHLQNPEHVAEFKLLLKELKKAPKPVSLGYSLWTKVASN